VQEIGSVADFERTSVDGSGIVYGRTAGSILQTWYYRVAYRLTAERRLRLVEQPLYRMGSRCVLKRKLPLRASPTDSTIVATPARGDSVEIVASDNKRWCIVQTKHDVWGWFEVIEYDIVVPLGVRASEVMDGLTYGG
jgi:hypothetical protein